MSEPVIRIKNLVNRFGQKVIHDHLNLEVQRGEILGIVGGSGSGKTVLLKSILGLHKPTEGSIEVLGQKRKTLATEPLADPRWGVMFQNGALFSSLTVEENIQVPIKEIARLPSTLSRELVYLKLAMVGLEPETAQKYPEELSGGMIKRVALARGLVLDAEILFLDEPTAGLDPVAAASFDKLIVNLQKNLDLTVVMVTHDLDTLQTVCDRVAVLVDKGIIIGTVKDIKKHPHPWIQEYFNSRGSVDNISKKEGKKH